MSVSPVKIIWLVLVSILPHKEHENMFVEDSDGGSDHTAPLESLPTLYMHHTKVSWSRAHHFPKEYRVGSWHAPTVEHSTGDCNCQQGIGKNRVVEIVKENSKTV